MKMYRLLTFEEVFPDEEKKEFQEYLSNIHETELYKLAANFATIIDFKSSKEEIDHTFTALFGPYNKEFATKPYRQILSLINNGDQWRFFNPFSSLVLFEETFKIKNHAPTPNYEVAEQNIFKAYLAINSFFVKRQEKAFISTENEEDEDLKFAQRLFCQGYPDHDKSNFILREQFICQSLKSIFLFEFLSKQDKLENLLNVFYERFGIEKWQDFVQLLFPIAENLINKEDIGQTEIVIDPNKDNYENICDFIDNLALSEKDKTEQIDFLSLRGKPFIKSEEGKYLVIFDLFVIEKYFKGIYFLLFEINGKLPKAMRINNEEFRNIFTFDFSEKTLLYKAMSIIYPNEPLAFTGKVLDEMGISAAPDFYLRNGKDLLLFESKDILIKKEVKYSYDIEKYDNEFGEKLFGFYDKHNKWHNKAVLQLINSVSNVLKKLNSFDVKYKPKEVNIYPIILLHDFQYEVPGFEYWINTWFEGELEALKEKGLYVKNIKPLTIMCIDSLLLHSEPLKNKIKLHKALEIYHKRKKKWPWSKKKISNYQELVDTKTESLMPFSIFLDNYLIRRKINKYPSLNEYILPFLKTKVQFKN